MVSTIRYIFLFSVLFLMESCTKNEFTLQFDVAPEVTENYNVIYYATDHKGGMTIQAVASLRDGKCELKGVTRHPTLIFLTERRSNFPLVFYADKGEKLKITGENNSPLQWLVDGNIINEQLSEWRIANKEFLADNLGDSVNMEVRRYVEENPSNPVSTILMLCYYNRNDDERGYTELMGLLSGEAKSSDWLSIVGRSDQLFHDYSYPARLESLIMRSINKSGDTLMTDKKNPVMIWFWQTGYDKRGDVIDSIKVLEKEFPDSSRLIADVCMDIDSVAWKNAIRKDSLNDDMPRFWAPMGMSDRKMMKFKVKQLPYFIVFDKDGNQSYRGGDISKALEDYRTLFNATDTTSKTL